MMFKVLFFCGQDPYSASAWSNVPNRFIHALEKRGVRVVGVQTNRHARLEYFCNHVLRRVMNVLLFTKTRYYNRTRLSNWLSERVIKKAVVRNPDADLCIFIGYQFYNKWSPTPSLLFSDWSNEIAFEREGARPTFFQRRNLRQEREAITHADHVVSMFPVCAARMRELYPEANILYLGGNVVNNFYEQELDEDAIIMRKRKSHSILFVGRKDNYKDSAVMVVEAFRQLKQSDAQLRLDLIGITTEQLGVSADGLTCHGFLHKDDPKECAEYYELLMNARLIVNPTPRWAAYSSLIEAMYFYTPVVVSPFPDFVEEFGAEIGFGRYVREQGAERLRADMQHVMSNDQYVRLCHNAHDAVKDYTWDNYVEKILSAAKVL